MQRVLAVIFLLAVFFHQSQAQCSSTNCVAPACRCRSTSTPGNLNPANTPQLVFLSFDGAVTTTNYDNYTYLLNNRMNPNGCPIGMTFFIYQEYNDFTLTHSLYHKRQEIATHSMSHRTPQELWASKLANEWVDEIGGMKEALAKFANIPKAPIRGSRAPFLQTSGDQTFSAMKTLNMFYDSSLPTTDFVDPPIWPYTLDQGFQHDCLIPPCPSDKFPGIWTVPVITLENEGIRCNTVEACPQPKTLEETYQFLKRNFERHYFSSKAPFGVYLNNNGWFQSANFRLEGYKKFLDYLSSKDDVYIVPLGRGLDWMKDPKPLSEVANFFNCPPLTQTSCQPVSCFYDGEASAIGPRNMKSCVPCPDVYPWTGNPLGIA